MSERKEGREGGAACLGRSELCEKLRKVLWKCAKNIVTKDDNK